MRETCAQWYLCWSPGYLLPPRLLGLRSLATGSRLVSRCHSVSGTKPAGRAGIAPCSATGAVIGGGVLAYRICPDLTGAFQMSARPSVAGEPGQPPALRQADQAPDEATENDAHRPITLGLNYSVATAALYAAPLVLALILGALVL